MTMNARTIGRLTLGEFAVQFAGWLEANGVEEGPRPPTLDEFEAADWDFG